MRPSSCIKIKTRGSCWRPLTPHASTPTSTPPRQMLTMHRQPSTISSEREMSWKVCTCLWSGNTMCLYVCSVKVPTFQRMSPPLALYRSLPLYALPLCTLHPAQSGEGVYTASSPKWGGDVFFSISVVRLYSTSKRFAMYTTVMTLPRFMFIVTKVQTISSSWKGVY